jgi:glycosyltransferase involved in cell wall biosynthesis
MCAKLIIQIPSFNEEDTLPVTFNALPKSVRGVDVVETMVINDGSTDNTLGAAKNLGVDHIIDLKTHRGLANAFSIGLREAAQRGADYLVNIDADNQYNADDIPRLLEPLIAGSADMVIGLRPVSRISHFSPMKKMLHRIGSSVIRRLFGVDIADSPSGFRAMNRKTMIGLFLFDHYTYTHESIIAAADSGLRVTGVPIRINEVVLRPSRLIKSTHQYVLRTGFSLLRFYFIYKPVKFFFTLSIASGIAGAAFAVRFMFFHFAGQGGAHVNSTVLAGIFIIASMVFFIAGILSDIMRINRKLIQKEIVEMREHFHGK